MPWRDMIQRGAYISKTAELVALVKTAVKVWEMGLQKSQKDSALRLLPTCLNSHFTLRKPKLEIIDDESV